MLAAWLAALWMGLAGVAHAREPVQIVTENLPPYSIAPVGQVGGQIGGLSTEIVRAAFARVGTPVDIQAMPWNRAFETARTTPGTFLYSMLRTPEREPGFVWIGRLVEIRLTLFALRDRPEMRATTLDEIKARGRVVVVNGDGAMLRLRQLGLSDEHLFILPDRAAGDQRHRLIEAGRAEYFISNPDSVAWRVKTGEFPDAFTPILSLPVDGHLYLAAHPDTDPALVAAVSAAFRALEADGTIEAIRGRYR